MSRKSTANAVLPAETKNAPPIVCMNNTLAVAELRLAGAATACAEMMGTWTAAPTQGDHGLVSDPVRRAGMRG